MFHVHIVQAALYSYDELSLMQLESMKLQNPNL